MTSRPARLIEDRQLRDAAKAVLADDIDRLRANLDKQGIASRLSSSVGSTISGRIRTGARDVLAQARAQAGDHKGVLAVLVGAIILWFNRGSISDWFDDFSADDDATEAELDPDIDPAPDPALAAYTASQGDPG